MEYQQLIKDQEQEIDYNLRSIEKRDRKLFEGADIIKKQVIVMEKMDEQLKEVQNDNVQLYIQQQYNDNIVEKLQ